MTTRLAVVVSHPIQYYAPWFADLAARPELELMVFHLWDFGIVSRLDRGFGQTLRWDVPLLEGYPSRLVPNQARDPGTHHVGGLHNPTLVRELLAWRPDALLLFGYAYRTHLRLLLDPRLWRLPILLRGDSHDLVPRRGLKPTIARQLRRLLFRRFAAALAVGQANAAYLAASGLAQDRIVLAPHAVDNARFQAAAPRAELDAAQWRQDLGIAADATVVLFAGKFEPKKQPVQLLEAFAALDNPTAVLVLVGAGALEQQLRRRAALLPPGRVHILGFQNQASMPRVYALADVLVLPSVGPGETWGLCVNEAMNLARPAIVSSHVGCGPDLVLQGRTGWVFAAGDLQALQRCLADALADRPRLRRLGLAARDHIQSFSYRQASASLLVALNRLRRGPTIDLVVPELYARDGGIQIYSRNLIDALLQLLPPAVRLRVFVRNDTPQQRPLQLDPRLELLACGHRSPVLAIAHFNALRLLSLLRGRPLLKISTHVQFAPIQLLLSRLAGCPAWASAHGIEVWNLKPGLRRWAIRRLDSLLPVSDYTAQQLSRQFGTACPPLLRLPNTYDDQQFQPGPRPAHLLQRYGLRPDQPLIFCLTRLTIADRYKRVRDLIEAMPMLLQRWPHLCLLIGGTGNDLPLLRDQVERMGLTRKVLLPGRIDPEELADHFRLASVFAMPSEKEGFGIVFLEAAGCGVPVLAGNRDGSVDALQGGRLGCLVDPRQPLAPSLQALLEGLGDPLWHEPRELSAAVQAAYGKAAFQQRLRELLLQVPALAEML